MRNDKVRICYFGTYNPAFSRNKIYIEGLRRNNIKVIECRDLSPFFLERYWKLLAKLWKIKNRYDILIVGYPGHTVVPFAKLISRKKVVFDALCSLSEVKFISRDLYANQPIKRKISEIFTYLVDWLAFHLADLVLIETDQQKKILFKKFKLSPKKCKRAFTGVDSENFYFDPKIKKRRKFTVLFRGGFLPEAGIRYILKAARILEKHNVNFLIIGSGFLEEDIKRQIKKLKLENLELNTKFLFPKKLRERMLSCHVSLGQFEKNERLKRTIPHKAFESLALKLPYVTGRAVGVEEILEDGKSCLFVNLADAKDLARAILGLKNNKSLRKKIAGEGHKFYKKNLTAEVLAKKLIEDIQRLF